MSLRDELKSSTDAAHEALHHHPLLAPLIAKEISNEEFQLALSLFHSFYDHAESMISVPLPDELPSAPVMDWLDRDRSCGHLTAAPLSPPSLQPVDSEARLLAYLYVKQGSTLGGQRISKNLEATLGLRPGIDQHFFAGYGPATGANWRSFLAGLASRESSLSETERREALDYAQHLFINLENSCEQMSGSLCS